MNLEEIRSEMEFHLLNDDSPSDYFNRVSDGPSFRAYPLTMLTRIKETKQSPKYHPEGSVWNHTMLVLDEAARCKEKSRNKTVFLWAALLHDIGKPDATRTRNGRITSYNHERLGSELSEKFLKEFGYEEGFIREACALVRWHMQPLFVLKSLAFADVESMKAQTSIEEIALLGFCDRMGRLGANREEQEANMRLFLKKCG